MSEENLSFDEIDETMISPIVEVPEENPWSTLKRRSR